MALKDTLKRAFLPVALAVTGAFASPAYAVEMGPDGCLPPAKLMAQLQAEGQMTAVKADRLYPATADSPARATFVAFTTNENGTRGYSFEGDQPYGIPSTKFCLSKIFTKTKVLNANVAFIPAGVAADGNLGKIIRYSSVTKHFNPVFYGESDGAITVVVGNPSIKGHFNGMILVGNNDPTVKADDQGGLSGLSYGANYERTASTQQVVVARADAGTPKP